MTAWRSNFRRKRTPSCLCLFQALVLCIFVHENNTLTYAMSIWEHRSNLSELDLNRLPFAPNNSRFAVRVGVNVPVVAVGREKASEPVLATSLVAHKVVEDAVPAEKRLAGVVLWFHACETQVVYIPHGERGSQPEVLQIKKGVISRDAY